MKRNSSRVNLKDLTDFVHQLMYWAASHLADRKEFPNLLKERERLLQAEEVGREVRLVKRRLVVSRSHSFRGWQGSVRQITSLMLIDWLKIILLLLNKQVPMPNLDLQSKHRNIEVWSRERFIAGSCKGERVTAAPKILTPGKGFTKASFKARQRRSIPGV